VYIKESVPAVYEGSSSQHYRQLIESHGVYHALHYVYRTREYNYCNLDICFFSCRPAIMRVFLFTLADDEKKNEDKGKRKKERDRERKYLA
jgi:hypothetical protein